MAMLASKSPYAAPSLSVPPARRSGRRERQPSPTESEFSEIDADDDPVHLWDEKRVGEWLRSLGCGEYEPIFRANNFNGDVLLECDQALLKEMGIKKVGDRVRIFVAVKALRNKAMSRQRRSPGTSMGDIDSIGSAQHPSSTSSSPRYAPHSSRYPTSARSHGRHPDDRNYNPPTAIPYNAPNQYLEPSPIEVERRPLPFRNQRSARSPDDRTQKFLGGTIPRKPVGSSRQTASHKASPSVDGMLGPLPSKVSGIRVISELGELSGTRVVKLSNPRSSEEVVRAVLRKFALREDQYKNYCFYFLDGLLPDPTYCRRITEKDLMQICDDPMRMERSRLILRRVYDGEPSREELRLAAEIAVEESNSNHQNALAMNGGRNQKIANFFGESWEDMQTPLSPASYHLQANDDRILSPVSPQPEAQPRNPTLRSFLGQRPPSELISSNLTTYFPDHEREEIEKAVRISIRRSQRLSRASNRLSMASNVSSGSLRDAPPVPSVGDQWLNGGLPSVPQRRPWSVVKFGGSPAASLRESMASFNLEPLSEESPIDANRKSYSSFEEVPTTPFEEQGTPISSTPIDPRISLTVTDENGKKSTDFDETSNSTPITENGDSLNAALGQALAEDGEEPDQELTAFITTQDWDNIRWMKGAMIGQGSFGSVYLGLHSITGELMAVKQVEMPANDATEVDSKKKSMIDALKREIGLLKELSHPNIVQYLGSSSDEDHLNIFLEYVAGGSVAAMLTQYGPLQEPLVRNFVRQILSGLSYLHGKDIIHRDIKGANVLVDNKGGIKISDFGISKRVETSSLLQKGAGNRVSLQGSVYWMAPEVVKQTSYTRKADIWSLGCLVVEMFTGTHPFPDCTQLQAIFKIGSNSATPTIPEGISAEAKSFLDNTFLIDHTKRPNAVELLQSDFLKPIA